MILKPLFTSALLTIVASSIIEPVSRTESQATYVSKIKKVKISVYYGSLDDESQSFIIDQLYLVMFPLRNLIEIEYIPYGKANYTKHYDGTFSFECENGPKECRANKYQVCALAQNMGQYQDTVLVKRFLSLDDPSDELQIKKLIHSTGYDYGKMRLCYFNGYGDELVAALGDKTQKLDPPLKYVPTIIYNDVYNQTLQEQSLKDLKKTLCSLIENRPKFYCDVD